MICFYYTGNLYITFRLYFKHDLMRLFTPIICLFFLFTIIELCNVKPTFSQIPQSVKQKTSSKWSVNPFEQKVFVENKGQFNENTEVNNEILFHAVSGGVNIYFTKQGIVYRHDEIIPKKKNDDADDKDEDENEERKVELIPHTLSAQWIGSNSSVEVTAEDKVSFYYTYSFDPKKEKEGIKASAYKKIIYHNLYPNIDVEYILPEDKKGIKYSLVLHPGANPSDIKMKWDGEKISQDASGNIVVKSSFGEFIDHAPTTYYSDGGSVASSFAIENGITAFKLSNFDNSRTIIIDPWTSSPTFSTNQAFDVNYDFAGNVYAYGSSGTYQLVKFNSAGVLQWVFSATSVSANGYYGAFAVDGTSGRSYLGEGYNGSGAQIAKVNTLGSQIGLYTGNSQMLELWRMAYNYCNGTIICAGGGTSTPSHQSFILDTNLVTITPVQVVSTLPDIDAALLSTDRYSNFSFILFARIYSGSQPTLDNLLVKCPLPGLIPTTWGTLTGHTFVEVSSVTYTGGGAGWDPNGFNGLAVSPNFVYTYDGGLIKKWNKTSGAFVSSLSVSGTLFSWGGLDVDECDNLYVGVQSAINVYDVNWAPVTTYPVSNTIYDLKLSGSKLYACGNGFVSEIDLTAATHTLTATSATCAQCNGTATAPSCSSTGFSYSWNPGGQTTQTATGLCPGTYTVTVSTNCARAFADTVTIKNTNIIPVSFTYTNVCIGQSTTFVDNTPATSGTMSSWTWNFGDGNTSNVQNPSHTYSASGTFSVTMNASSTLGCSGTITNTVTVNSLPVSNFSATTVCLRDTTRFTDLSTGALSWNWNFGNGNTSVLQNPPNTYSVSGTYSVSLITTTANGCKDTTVIPVTVNPLPIANFTTTPVCLNTPPMTFTNQSTGATQWNWNFGDASPNSTLQSPTHNYAAAGNYSVTLIATTANGCNDTTSLSITVNALPIPKFISLDKCFNNATPFTDQSTGGPTQWSWNFGDGNSAVQQNPSHTYASAGNYLVTLVATNGFGCKDSIQHHVIVNPLPVASFASNTVCIGNATSFTDHSSITSGSVSGWSWNFGDPASGANNISNLQDPSHVYPAAGNYTVILTATSDSGCQSTTNFIAMVQPPPVASFTVPAVCANTSTQFTDGSTAANQWKWQFGDGATSGIQNPAHTYAGYGTYVATLIVTSAGGCRDTAMDTVIVNALPVVNFSADTVCQGKTTHFAGFTSIPNGTLTSWNWNFGDVASGTSDTTSLQNPAHVFTQAGTFSVTFSATSNMGCVSTQTLAVPVHPLPAAAFSFSPGPVISITDNVAFNNLSSGGVSWTWSFGDNTSPTHAQNPMHIFTDTGTYVITQIVVSQFGCVDSIKHVLETKDFTFYIPNAFTPNGDGKNEYFFGKGIGITQYEMWIFDRWGNLIFYCNVNGLPQSQPCWWDGTVKGGSGTIVQQDVYVWKVHFTNVFSNTYNYIGTVTVVK